MLVVNLREEKTKELKQMLYIDNLSVDVESWHVDKKNQQAFQIPFNNVTPTKNVD